MKSEIHSNSESEAKRVLRARAQALARPPASTAVTETCVEVLEFSLAQERYAVDTKFVREVYPLKDLTPLPCVPTFVLGLVTVRGRILSVLDLKKFFDLPESGLTDLHRIIVVRGHELGILADAIIGVRALPLDSLQSSLPTLTGVRGEYLKGVTADRTVVLDLSHILVDPRIIVHEEVEL